jgi:phosphoglycerol transferase MdoB-like AlkP superfamily enzyme
MAKRKRQRLPLLYVTLGALAFVAFLNYIMGSPIQKWFADATNSDIPLLWGVLLMLFVAIAPFVILINLGEDEDGK